MLRGQRDRRARSTLRRNQSSPASDFFRLEKATPSTTSEGERCAPAARSTGTGGSTDTRPPPNHNDGNAYGHCPRVRPASCACRLLANAAVRGCYRVWPWLLPTGYPSSQGKTESPANPFRTFRGSTKAEGPVRTGFSHFFAVLLPDGRGWFRTTDQPLACEAGRAAASSFLGLPPVPFRAPLSTEQCPTHAAYGSVPLPRCFQLRELGGRSP